MYSCGSIENNIYKSKSLKIDELTTNSFRHVSYLKSGDKDIACNGIVVVENKKAIVVDCPTSPEASVELINYLKNDKNLEIQGVVVTHFHEDCLGGLQSFHEADIPSYGHNRTITICEQEYIEFPDIGFRSEMTLHLDGKELICDFTSSKQIQFYRNCCSGPWKARKYRFV